MKTQSAAVPRGGPRWSPSASGSPLPEEAAGGAAAQRAAGRRQRGRGRVLPRRAARHGRRTRPRRTSPSAASAPRRSSASASAMPPAAATPSRATCARSALSLDDAVTVGLVMRRAGGGLLDRFRDRLIFPIADPRGRVIAFGGRVLPGARRRPATRRPSISTRPSRRSSTRAAPLYGLGLARDAIRRSGRVVVVEGYLDVIALAQAGIGEVVAPLGHRAHRRAARVSWAASPSGSSPASTATPPAAAPPPAASRCSSTPGSGGAASSCPRATIPTPSSARTVRDAFARAARDRRAAHRGVAARGRRAATATRSDGAPRRRARWRACSSACAPAIRTSSTSWPVAPRRPSASPRSACAPRASARAGAPRSPAVPAGTRAAGPRGAHRRADGRRTPRWPSASARPTSSPSSSIPPGARPPSACSRTRGADRTALLQSLPRELRDRVARRLLDEGDADEREHVLADCIAAIQRRRLRRTRDPPARRAARRRGAWRRSRRRTGPATAARAPDGETPHVRSTTVRTTPATHDVLSPEPLVLSGRRRAGRERTSPSSPSTTPSSTTRRGRRRGRRADEEDGAAAKPSAAEDPRAGADPVRLYLRQMGAGVAAHPRGRGRDRQAHRGAASSRCSALALDDAGRAAPRARTRRPAAARRRSGCASWSRTSGDEDAEPGEDDRRQRAPIPGAAQPHPPAGGRARARSARTRDGRRHAGAARRRSRLAASRRAPRARRSSASGWRGGRSTLVVDELSRAAERVSQLQARVRALGRARAARPRPRPRGGGRSARRPPRVAASWSGWSGCPRPRCCASADRRRPQRARAHVARSRSWSRPTCGSSSRSPSATCTAGCSSST